MPQIVFYIIVFIALVIAIMALVSKGFKEKNEIKSTPILLYLYMLIVALPFMSLCTDVQTIQMDEKGKLKENNRRYFLYYLYEDEDGIKSFVWLGVTRDSYVDNRTNRDLYVYPKSYGGVPIGDNKSYTIKKNKLKRVRHKPTIFGAPPEYITIRSHGVSSSKGRLEWVVQ